MNSITNNNLANEVCEHPADVNVRLVYADWLEENGRIVESSVLRAGEFHRLICGGDGDGGGGGGGDGDGGDGGGGDGGDGGDGGGGGDGGDGDGGDGDGPISQQRNLHMQEGFNIVSIPSGWYPYVLVGWCRQIEGFEWEMLNVCVIRRFGSNGVLAKLAVEGPIPNSTHVLPASKREVIFRPNVSRCIPADPKAWKNHCPKPKEWE